VTSLCIKPATRATSISLRNQHHDTLTLAIAQVRDECGDADAVARLPAQDATELRERPSPV